MVHKCAIQIGHYLVTACRIQIFATLVSLSILTYWGLPSSVLTVLGNIIFTPILTLFLLISSGIFFLELLNLPNQALITALEWLTSQWLKIIPTRPQQYLIALPKACWWIFVIGIVVIVLCIIVFKLNRLKQTILMGTVCLICILIGRLPVWRRNTPLILNYRHKTVTITPHRTGLIIQDTGTLNYASGSANWIQYTLVPAIISEFGTLQVQQLILQKSSRSTCKNLALLQKYIHIQDIIQNTLNVNSIA